MSTHHGYSQGSRTTRAALMLIAASAVVAAAFPVLLFAKRPVAEASRARPGEIPFGTWAGEGTFVYDIEEGAESIVETATRELVHDLTGLPLDEVPVEKPGNDGRPTERHTVERRYRTELAIEPLEVDDRELVLMTIRSRRGPLPDLDKETRLLVALEKSKRASSMVSLYRVASFAFNPPDGAGPDLQDLGAAAACTCITRDDVSILQIRYMDNFVDTFRFDGDRVEKTGVFGSKSGLIHWVEQLRER